MIYIKRIQKQDKEKSFFIFKEAFDKFFTENPKIGTKEEINIIYNNVEIKAELQNHGRSDFRIINFKNKATGRSNRPSYEEGDIVVLNKRNNVYYFKTITSTNEEYSELNSLLGTNNNMMIEEKKHSLNQILYGPPGTGKTYSTIQKSLEILDQHSLSPDLSNRIIENREKFKSLLNKRIFFVTMHPSYSYEDFVQGIKPKTIEGNLTFESKDGIFKVASKIALTNHQGQKASKINFESVFDFAFKPLLEDDIPVKVERGTTPFKIIKADSTLKFETSTGNTGPTYNLSIKTLKKIYEAGVNNIILSGNKGYFDSLLEFLNKKEAELKSQINEGDSEFSSVYNVVLVLDEINRANISKVFGELITLLEEDKRIDGENELTVTLPSGEIYGIPPNLYVIGTMNTADKSIALVDIALRRRFQFEAMYPKPEIVKEFGKCDDAVKTEKIDFMTALNTRLRKDKGVDFQIGHAYFMKENSLEEVINQNIIPLLTEYYRNDLDKVKKIMTDLGKPIDQDTWDTFGLLEYKS